MDLHSIISYHPHPHRSLHKLKRKRKKVTGSVSPSETRESHMKHFVPYRVGVCIIIYSRTKQSRNSILHRLAEKINSSRSSAFPGHLAVTLTFRSRSAKTGSKCKNVPGLSLSCQILQGFLLPIMISEKKPTPKLLARTPSEIIRVHMILRVSQKRDSVFRHS